MGRFACLLSLFCVLLSSYFFSGGNRYAPDSRFYTIILWLSTFLIELRCGLWGLCLFARVSDEPAPIGCFLVFSWMRCAEWLEKWKFCGWRMEA